MNKTLWLIPARGGSKGIPRKNIIPFCGKPLVSRAISQALECSKPDDVVFVSTDSEEIKNTSMSEGIEIPFLRPSHLATDEASSQSVILHVLEEFRKKGIEFQKVVLLQPTSPLRTTRHIKEALSLWKPGLDMVVSVNDSKANPYFNLFEENPEGYLHLSKGNGGYVRRQDAPKVWEYNGAVYVMAVSSLENTPISGFKKIIPYPMDSMDSVDLDSPLDWKIAEMIYLERTRQM